MLHTDPETYNVVTATCADCEKPVPLCGGPDTYGCPKCQIFAETPEVLLQKCRADILVPRPVDPSHFAPHPAEQALV
eukprot:COSAG06_NODE_4905_length_3870_cov_2.133121_5_plen_77_part_00